MSVIKPTTVARAASKLPDDLLESAVAEVLAIDWNRLPYPDRRSKTAVFSTSTAIHLRVHKVGPGTPDTLTAHGDIIECVDTTARPLYPAIEKIVSWVYSEVGGFHMGRAMIVKLAPYGQVGVHIDRGAYFRFHKRFHVPLVTNREVFFHTDDLLNSSFHMATGSIYQLHNDRPHGVTSGSDRDRIHLVLDIATDDTRFGD